jgi:nitrate/nitrite transporter NarK
MNWFEFLSGMSSAIETYITLILFSIWLSYLAKKEKHLLSRVSFLEADVGFFIVIFIVILYEIGMITESSYISYVFFSAIGIMWGILGLIWGLTFYFIPIEKILKITPKRRRVKKFKYPRPEV